MARRRQVRVRYYSVRGGHHGAFGPRYLGYHMPIRHRHYKRRARSRRNPAFFPNPGGGGSKLLLYGAIGIGAFFLLRGGALGNLFGGAAPPGYTQLGTSAYYRGPDGQLYTRTATGGMMLSPTQAPVGSAVEQQLIAAGSRLALPVVGALATGLSSMLSNLFTGGSATVNVPADTAGSAATGGVPTSDVLGAGGYNAGLPPLPTLPDLQLSDWWSAPDSSSWFTPANYSLNPQPVSVMSMDMSLAPLPELPTYDYGSGFFGLGARARYAGYGSVRVGPSGELEARFLRQPPSSR
jgi:hypothetical protein